MQAGLALLMAYHFHRATHYGNAGQHRGHSTHSGADACLCRLLSAWDTSRLRWPSLRFGFPALALEGIAGTVHFLAVPISLAHHRRPARGHALLAMILASIAALALAMLAAQVRRTRVAAFASVVLLFGVAVLDCVCPLAPSPSRRRDGDDDH